MGRLCQQATGLVVREAQTAMHVAPVLSGRTSPSLPGVGGCTKPRLSLSGCIYHVQTGLLPRAGCHLQLVVCRDGRHLRALHAPGHRHRPGRAEHLQRALALAVEGIFDSISAGAQGACVLRGAGVPPLVGRACAERGVTYTCALCPEDRLKCLLAQEIVLYTWPATGCLRSSPAAVWAGRVLPPQAALRIG